MMPGSRELLRALLRRALGGRAVAFSPVLAAAVGTAAGWAAARALATGLGARPSGGLLPWLLVHFDRTALYGLGATAALQVAACYGEDARSGWTVQYLAAGGTRDRYILALAGAQAAASALLYLLAVGAWLAALAVLGRPTSELAGSTVFLPTGLLWLATPPAFATVALVASRGSGRAMGLMLATLLLPWFALAALHPDPDLGVPAWLSWATAIAPPYPITAGFASAGLCLAYSAVLLVLAWALAPRNLFRL